MKYVEANVTFAEVPDEISLSINISNCPYRCQGCHSPHLWEDIGTELDWKELNRLIESNAGITCVNFMGGDSSMSDVQALAYLVRNKTGLKVCWYSGRTSLLGIDLDLFDYLKLGPYQEKRGSLRVPDTNQVMYQVDHSGNKSRLSNITYKFQERAI